MTEETKKVLSILAKNRFKDKTNHPFYGKHHSLKTKIILNKKCANRGRNNGRFDSKIYKFVNVSGETFIGTRYDFCQKYSIHSSRVSAVIRKINNLKQVGGWSITPFQ